MKKLIIFDLDGTLVKPFTDQPLPDALDWFNNWNGDPLVAIATNQGGVALRALQDAGIEGWWSGRNYPTEQETKIRIWSSIKKLGGKRAVFDVQRMMCYYHPAIEDYGLKIIGVEWDKNFRKPNPGMIKKLVNTIAKNSEEALVVGDSEDDELAADNAGVDFCHRDVFFSEGWNE